jgi:hypothetical protein
MQIQNVTVKRMHVVIMEIPKWSIPTLFQLVACSSTIAAAAAAATTTTTTAAASAFVKGAPAALATYDCVFSPQVR